MVRKGFFLLVDGYASRFSVKKRVYSRTCFHFKELVGFLNPPIILLQMPLEKVVEGSGGLASPAINKDGVLHVVCTQTGSICKLAGGELVEVLNTEGQPSAIAFDPLLHNLYVCDLAHQVCSIFFWHLILP